jgi:hypothetical protein
MSHSLERPRRSGFDRGTQIGGRGGAKSMEAPAGFMPLYRKAGPAILSAGVEWPAFTGRRACVPGIEEV